MFIKFLRDRAGAVLPTFAIAAIPLIVATGAVVDYSRAFDQQTVVQDALDGAALASGKKIGISTDTAIKAEAQTFFTVNIGAKVNIMPTLAAVISGANITLTTQLHVPTYFLGMIGINEFIYDLKAQTTQAMGTIEVAMALDNSGSMSGTKIATLIDAAGDLTDTLYGLGVTSTKPNPVMVGLVPFASSVKVDPANKTSAWMDTTGVAPYNAENFEGSSGSPPVSNNTPAGTNVLNLFNNLAGTGSAWAGCVEERKAPYDVQDDVAATATPATMFVPMFAPDEPDNWTCTTAGCTDTCNNGSCTSASAGLRYNGAPTGTVNHNNYLPDAGGMACGPTLTMTSAKPAVFTSTAHGLTAGTEIMFQTTGALYTGLTVGTPYYVVAANIAANTFRVSATAPADATTFTVTKANPGVFTTTANHGLTVGTPIALTTSGGLYTGLSTATTYFVKTVPTTKTFTVSTTSGGTAVNTTGSQSGTHKFVVQVATSGSQSGAHTFSLTANWTCANGATGCGTGSVGDSEQTALLGQNVASKNLCKYGSATYKATIASTSVQTNGGTYPGGPNFNCTTDPVVPLTVAKATVKTAISNMAADGTTNITAGLMWGWRILSPTAPYTEGRSYTTAENQKILILMTDGENTYFANGKFTVSHYGAWGYIAKSHLGTTSSVEDDMQTKMEDRMETACANIKTAGIKIYTVAFEIDDAATLKLLSDCATDTTKAFSADDPAALTAAFAAIGEDISLLRLAL